MVLVCMSKHCKLKNCTIKTLVATSLWLYLMLFFFFPAYFFVQAAVTFTCSIRNMSKVWIPRFCQMQKQNKKKDISKDVTRQAELYEKTHAKSKE